MSVSNLTNTKWVLKENPSINNDNLITYNINFTSNGNNYISFSYFLDDGKHIAYTNINSSTEVYWGGYGGWFNDAYRIIEITGGTDVTNANLISWLEANATQVQVDDLTNTKWSINTDVETFVSGRDFTNYYNNEDDGPYSLNFTSNGNTYSSIFFQSVEDEYSCIKYDSTIVLSYSSGPEYVWTDYNYHEVTISGGTNATNPDLIAWLSQNATLQPSVSVKTFDLSTLGLTTRTHTVKVKARASGYRDSNFSNSVTYTETRWSCVVANLGSYNPSSVTFTHTGTMPTFEEVTIGSNVFIKIPKMYRKIISTSSNQITSFEIANYKKDNDFVPYPCFIKEDGTTEMDYVLIGKYYSNSSDTMNSINTTVSTQAFANARTHARALGSGYQLYDWQIHKLWQDLIICKKNTVNTNDGNGIGTNYYDDFGIYWGTNGSWLDGILFREGSWYLSYKPSDYSCTSGLIPSAYLLAGYSGPTRYINSYTISKLGYDSSNPFFNFPNDVATNTLYKDYYCDAFTVSNEVKPGIIGPGSLYASSGAFSCTCALVVSTYAARLCYRPI